MNTITQQELTQKLLAMAAVCAAGLPQRKTKAHPRFNHLRTVNSYGEFTWHIKREKGHPVAVINRKGKLYCRVPVYGCYGYQSVQDEIIEFIQDRLCCEVGNGQA